eukprot:7592562-Lingulodinium_polyedra.AAC.1
MDWIVIVLWDCKHGPQWCAASESLACHAQSSHHGDDVSSRMSLPGHFIQNEVAHAISPVMPLRGSQLPTP